MDDTYICNSFPKGKYPKLAKLGLLWFKQMYIFIQIDPKQNAGFWVVNMTRDGITKGRHQVHWWHWPTRLNNMPVAQDGFHIKHYQNSNCFWMFITHSYGIIWNNDGVLTHQKTWYWTGCLTNSFSTPWIRWVIRLVHQKSAIRQGIRQICQAAAFKSNPAVKSRHGPPWITIPGENSASWASWGSAMASGLNMALSGRHIP